MTRLSPICLCVHMRYYLAMSTQHLYYFTIHCMVCILYYNKTVYMIVCQCHFMLCVIFVQHDMIAQQSSNNAVTCFIS